MFEAGIVWSQQELSIMFALQPIPQNRHLLVWTRFKCYFTTVIRTECFFLLGIKQKNTFQIKIQLINNTIFILGPNNHQHLECFKFERNLLESPRVCGSISLGIFILRSCCYLALNSIRSVAQAAALETISYPSPRPIVICQFQQSGHTWSPYYWNNIVTIALIHK